jgi:TonB family protein
MATQPSDSSKYKLRTSASDELAVIAQRAQAFTNASGAAIALSEGNTDEIVCRARSGSSAPDVGVALRVEGSFTGLCIQSGKELRCDDAETDTRVDTAAIRALGIRSMVVTPIKEEGKVTGVLAVFAPTPHAFTITHVAVLKTMADQIASLLLKERRARDEGHMSEPVVTAPKPPVAVAPPPPPPVVIKPASSGSSAAAAAPARVSASTAPKIEPIKPEVPAPVPFPKREEKRPEPRIEPKPEPVAKASFGTLDAVAGEHKKSEPNKFLFVGIAVVVLVVAASAWLFMRKGKSAPQQTAQAAPAATSTAPPANSTVASTSAPAFANTPAQPSSTSSSTTTAAPANTKPAPAEKPENKKPEQQNKPEPSKPSPAAPAPATVALSSGPSKISTGNVQQPTADVAPSLAVGSSSPSALNSLARPANTPTPAMIAQSELVNAQLLRQVGAVYPAIAKARHMSATIMVRITVGKDGKVYNPKLINGPAIFEDAAFTAVKQWQYKPALLNGQPIEQQQDIKINFHP